MNIISAGNSATFTLPANNQLTVESRGGTTVTGPSGLLGTVDGTSTFGAYSTDTVITVAAVGQDCSYGVIEPSNARLTTTPSGGVAIAGPNGAIPLLSAAPTGTITTPTKTVAPISAPEVIATNYAFWVTGQQAAGSGAGRDLSGNSASMAITPTTNLSDANAWSNAGWMTCLTNSTAFDGFRLAKAKWNPDISTQSFILAFKLKIATPASNPIIMGQGDSTRPGVYVQARSTGAISIGFRDSLGVNVINASNSTAVCDGAEHSVMFAFDALTKVSAIFIDGVLDYTNLNSTLIGSTTSAYDFGVGGSSVTFNATTAMQVRYMHGIVITGSLPTNLGDVAYKAHTYPSYPINQSDMVFTVGTRRVVAIVGQSNEAGNDIGNFRKTNLYGCPNADVTTASGGSWWPLFAEALFVDTSAYSYVYHYTAKGSSSILVNWCGTTTGTVSGTPYSMADGASFDPNKYLSGSATAVKELLDAATGFDEKWVFVSIGQQDASLSATSAKFAQGYINVIDWALAQGYKVAVGFTFYSPLYDSWYSDNGNPAIATVLANYAGNANVVAGANLYATLGTAINLPTANVHADSRGYDLAAIAWRDAMKLAGW